MSLTLVSEWDGWPVSLSVDFPVNHRCNWHVNRSNNSNLIGNTLQYGYINRLYLKKSNTHYWQGILLLINDSNTGNVSLLLIIFININAELGIINS